MIKIASLSLIGWINALSASGLVVFGTLFGIYILYKAKKTDARLIYYLGFTVISAALGWLGNLVDFITILLTSRNMANPHGIYIVLSNVWLPLTIVLAIYVGIELIMPEKTKFILPVFIVLALIYEFFLLIDPFGSYNFVYPTPNGSNLIDEILITFSPLGILTIVFIVSVAVFIGIGFLIKAIQSSDKIRTNFVIISLAAFLFILFGMLDTSGGLFPTIFLVFIRLGILSSLVLMYLGFFRHIGSVK
ncbi:MAG: hypothetical protein GF383_08010 [Candidatus Lokiarchaeota archaeon]|nr:hypothetical protein [Candidatus Lokiarchaeota archaeon]MBD3340276.1 hypothetical protein [Candidatus Lokiarchaeota archaeon]